MEEEGAHAMLRLCLEFYLNVTLRVHFSFAFKRIFVMHSFFFEPYITRAFLSCFQTNIFALQSFFKIFVTLPCDLEAR